MSETTFEEAKRCPKCNTPGEDTGILDAVKASHATVHVIQCVNRQCKWYATSYLVQVNEDGSVPPPRKNQPKAYPMPKLSQQQIERIENTIQRQLEQETKPGGGEVRGSQ